VDYSIFWRRLSHHVAGDAVDPLRDLFLDREAFDVWELHYSERLKTIPRRDSAKLMLRTNPKYILRNHLGEEAIRAARSGDFSDVGRLLGLLESPFDEHPDSEALAGFPPDWAASISISCSS
jgi:uncharacterized protein YdiU (UPF0061 family)